MYQTSYHDPFLSPPSDHHHNLHAIQPSSSSFHQHGSIDLQEQFFDPNPPYSFLQRSSSSISLHQTNGQHNHGHRGMFEQQQLDQLSFNSQATVGVGSMRRVFSAGDIQAFSQHVLPESMQQQQQQPANSGDNSSQELGGGVMAASGRVGRYSAEERRERIERYRNKRNQRNFHKKITYACRKTLADRRPRVHGRFARNEEPEVEIINAEAAESVLHGNWGFQTEAAAMTMMAAENDSYYCFDGELWNDFADVFSANNPNLNS